MGPNNTTECSLKCDFLILFNYELFCRNLVFIVKTPNLIKKLFLCYVSKPRVGPLTANIIISNEENIFAALHTLVLSLMIFLTS